MAQIIAQNLGVTFGERLFHNVNFSLGEGDRIGVVGNNGAGKSTLLRCIAGLTEPTEGNILRPKHSRLGFVEQAAPPELVSLTLREAILDAIPTDERDLTEWRVDLVLDGFGAPEDMRERVLSKLSGGWQRLALIARVWVTDPDFLIIDEPTNHLDLLKIMLLETWLKEEVSATPLLIVSHDRRFLDQCTNHTLFLRPGDSRLYAHPFSPARELLFEEDRALDNQKERELKEAQRLRKSAHSLRQIGVNNYSAAALRKSIQIAKRAEKIEDSLPNTHVESARDIRLASRGTHSKRILSIENLIIRRPDAVPLFQINHLEIGRGDRVVVLGQNGTGKSQLVHRLRAGFANLDSARAEGITIAPSVVMGYIDQNMSQIPNSDTLRTYVSDIHRSGDQRSMSLLVSAGFPVAQHNERISSLSLGQKARLALLAVRLLEPSFFLMDEPTNHLDIAGQEQLEAEILTHEATALLVSHDRRFVENTGTRFLVVEDSRLFEIDSPEPFYRSLAEDVPLSQLLGHITIR
ncbi:MAG: ABC-F family ATP-binding cassette domain-containing protein [Pyrinomonadaceae bacterium]